ncbi:topoisomerase DNA-binding C4 zinc finger domain-containing protein [Haloparvum sp. AD34]
MPDRMRVFAGDCTTSFDDEGTRTQRGRMVVLVKPDNTTLVHDADGYQPVEWLTRPDSITVETDGDGFSITARTPDRTLRVVAVDGAAGREIPVTQAGTEVGTCPDCDEPLVRTGGDVVCLACDASYGLPSGASVTDRTCEDCGLPKIRVERGEPFQLCLDPSCERLPDVVAERFDGEWDCPDCGADLEVREAPGRVFLGCTDYPDCETTFSMPNGVVVDDCPCGLPVFETPTGKRCLDGTCDRWQAIDDEKRTAEGDAGGG